MVTINTNFGNIKLELFEKEAPITCENFLNYIDQSFYDGTIFHRVIDGFMIQGGGFDINFSEKETKAPIKNEADNGLSNDRGTLAMARTMDINSATSQFFINVKDNDFLNFQNPSPQGFGYCVFAKVVDGMDLVDKIKTVETGSKGPHQDVPIKNVLINKIVRD